MSFIRAAQKGHRDPKPANKVGVTAGKYASDWDDAKVGVTRDSVPTRPVSTINGCAGSTRGSSGSSSCKVGETTSRMGGTGSPGQMKGSGSAYKGSHGTVAQYRGR